MSVINAAGASSAPASTDLGGASNDAATKRPAIEQGIAAVALFAVSLQFAIGPGLMPRHAVALLLLPAWIVVMPRFRGARLLLLLGSGAAVSGIVLAAISAGTHNVAQKQTISVTLVLLGFVTGIAVVLWSRTILSDRWVGLFFSAGLLVDGATGTGPLGTALAGANALKFGWAIPITVVVLSALEGRRLGAQFFGMVMLAVLAIVSDARAMLAVCVLGALLIAWQLRPTKISRAKSWVWTAAMIGGLGVLIYNIGTTLLVQGYLGADAQARSIGQLGTAGSLIIGGRPELAATAALFRHRPWGFGSGVSVNHSELLSAKAGMAAINYDPNNGYVDKYLFGGNTIELHSTLGDLWASFGLIGVALALLIVWLVVQNLSTRIAHRLASGLALFLGIWSLWNVYFSPLYSTIPTMMLAIGLLLRKRDKKAGPIGPTQQRMIRQA